jgi:3-phosphoshikimate 1-carboxyvinyltransferase
MATLPVYPPTWPVDPFQNPAQGEVRVPGSKSITNRALVLAALCRPRTSCELSGVLFSEDTEVMVQCLQKLGVTITTTGETDLTDAPRVCEGRLRPCRCSGTRAEIEIVPPEGAFVPREDLYVANSGTTMRFLTALVSLGCGRYRLDGVPRMRERPIADLLRVLQQLGVYARSEANNGCPPVVVETRGLSGGRVSIKGSVSSQFLSGLLMAAPRAQGDITIEVDGVLVSRPYVDMTVAMLRQFGARMDSDARRFHIPGGQILQAPRRYVIEPDASGASYFLAAAAITCGQVRIPHLGPESLQGDVRFADLLERMGCVVRFTPEGLEVQGAPLRGIDADMNALSDTVMTLAAVALFAQGPTTIRNVGHIRHKETDRLAALARELRKLGAEVEERADGLTITPAPLHGAELDTYEDHRLAMALALVGLVVPGVVIHNPGCVAKTYPHFFADLETLRC